MPLGILTSLGSSIYVSCEGTVRVLSPRGFTQTLTPQAGQAESLAQCRGPLGWKAGCESGPVSANILYTMRRIHTRQGLEEASLKEQFIDLADD